MSIESLLLAQVWQIAVIAGVVWGISKTLTRNQAHLSHLLWLVVLVKCLTPPIWSSPLSLFSWASTQPRTPIVTEPVPTLPLPADSFPSEVAPPMEPLDADELERARLARMVAQLEHTSESESNSIPNLPVPAPTISPSSESSSVVVAQNRWQAWLLFGWLGTAAVFIVWTLYRAARFVRGLVAAEVENEGLQSLANDISESLGLRKPPRLLITSWSVGPAVIGLLRPMIVVPKFIVDRSTREEMKPILAHELIHIRRGDLWVGLLRHATRSLWWFHPFVWKTSSALRMNAERCCDEEVVASLGISANDYARSLLSVLELKKELKAVPIVPGVRPFDITSKRLERIMELGSASRSRTPAWCWIVAVIFAVVSLPGAGLMFGKEADDIGDNIEATRYLESATEETAPALSRPARPVPRAQFPITEPAVQIQCQIISGTAEEIATLSIPWRTISRPDLTQNPIADNNPDNLSSWGNSSVVVEKRMPVFYAITDSDVAQNLLQRAESSSRLSIVSRPVLTAADGKSGTISIGKQRVFPIGLDERNEIVEFQTTEGIRATFLPSISRRGSHLDVLLAYRIAETTIESVEEFAIEATKLKIPETKTSTISGAHRIPQTKLLMVRLQGSGGEEKIALIRTTPLIPSGVQAEARAANADNWETIPWGLLQKTKPTEHIIAPGDVLGAYIVGVLGSENQLPPVQLPGSDNVPPSLGFPIPVRKDGTIPLPLINDPVVAGMTIQQAEQAVRDGYTKHQTILQPDQPIILTLVRPKTHRITVFREDAMGANGRIQGNRFLHETNGKTAAASPRNNAFELHLSDRDADLLNALANTGGLPGLTVTELLVYRNENRTQAIRIPLRYRDGQLPDIDDDDISLRDGDIVVISPHRRSTTSTPVPHKKARALQHKVPAIEQRNRPSESDGAATNQRQPRQLIPTSENKRTVAVSSNRVDELERRQMTLNECVKLCIANSNLAEIGEPSGTNRPMLLANSGVAVQRGPVPLNPTDADRVFDQQTDLETLAFEVVQAYWNLHFHCHNLDATRTLFAESHATWKKTSVRAKAQAKDGEAANEAQARAQYFATRARLEQAKHDLQHSEQHLRRLLGMPNNSGKLIWPIDSPTKARIEFDWQEAKALALNKNPELLRQRERLR